MSDSNDSDSAVFSGSERGGASNLNGCRRKHHRDCPNKSKQQQQRGPSRNTNSNSGTLREWEIQYDPNTQQAMTTNTQSNAPCMCQVPSQIPGQQNFNPGQCQNVMQNPNYVELVNPFVEQNSGGSNSSRRSRSQDFLDINEAHGIPHQVRLQSAQNLRTGNNYRSRNGRSGHANFAYRSSQGYHSENDSYRAPLASTRGRPVMGGSRGYKSETDDGGSSVVSAGRGSSNGGGSNQRVTTAQRAFALLRKQQQEQLRLQQREQQQQKLQTHQYEQIRIWYNGPHFWYCFELCGQTELSLRKSTRLLEKLFVIYNLSLVFLFWKLSLFYISFASSRVSLWKKTGFLMLQNS